MAKPVQLVSNIIPKSTIPKSKGVNAHSSELIESFEREIYEKPINPIDIKISKKFYGVKAALDNLDEEFNFFKIKKYSIKDFFELYSTNFYDAGVLPRKLHIEFINKSINYAFPDGYENYRMKEKKELLEQLSEIQHQIDSVEREHAFFKNGNFIMDKRYIDSSGDVTRGSNIYYLQSARKRSISSFQAYLTLKTRLRKNQDAISEEELIIFVDTKTLNQIPDGPFIRKGSDINIEMAEINTYNPIGSTSSI